MIILSKYDMTKISDQLFYIRCKEKMLCPCCRCTLKVIGSRKRKYINSLGEKITLIIRRLKCTNCKKIHHELPDILVPYKHYDSECIENVITGLHKNTVAAEDSTIYRWKKWIRRLLLKIHTYLLYFSEKISIKNKLFHYVNLNTPFLTSYPKRLSALVCMLVNLDLL